MSSTALSADWDSFIIPPIFVGIACFLQNVFGHGYLPDSPHVWIDVVGNIFAYEMSKVITDYSFDQMFDSGFIEQGFNSVAMPALQGLMNGTIKYFTPVDSIRGLNFYSALPTGKLPKPEHYGFMSGFAEGAVYNIIGTYMSLPYIG